MRLRAATLAELRAAELEQEAADVQAKLSATAADMKALGARMRELFDSMAAGLPGLVTAQSRFAGLNRRAAVLRARHGLSVQAPTVSGGIDARVVYLLGRAIAAQSAVDSR